MRDRRYAPLTMPAVSEPAHRAPALAAAVEQRRRVAQGQHMTLPRIAPLVLFSSVDVVPSASIDEDAK
jgi:hypothetical protein